MKPLVQLVLSVLLPVSTYARDVALVTQVQPTSPVQPSSTEPLPKPVPVLPPQTTNESGHRWNSLTLAIGLGYGIPFGGFIDDSLVSQIAPLDGSGSVGSKVSGQVPFSIGFAYRPIPWLSFGIATAYAPLFMKNCESSSGSGSDKRLRGELRAHIKPRWSFSPWASAGIGYEWFGYSRDPCYGSYEKVSASGFDFDLQVGGDWAVANSWTVGPYVELSVGSFRHLSAKCGGRSCVGKDEFDIPEGDRIKHGWLTFGVRGALPIFAR
jgi:hypothetical protein